MLLELLPAGLEHVLDLILEASDLLNLRLVGRQALLNGADGSAHLMGNCGVQHGGQIVLADGVLELLALSDVDELHHLDILVVLFNKRELEAEEDLVILGRYLPHLILVLTEDEVLQGVLAVIGRRPDHLHVLVVSRLLLEKLQLECLLIELVEVGVPQGLLNKGLQGLVDE